MFGRADAELSEHAFLFGRWPGDATQADFILKTAVETPQVR
jgi:hypothetical protein